MLKLTKPCIEAIRFLYTLDFSIGVMLARISLACRKLLIFLIVIFLAFHLIGLSLPHHVDPRSLTGEKPSPLDLLFLYSLIIDYIHAGNYTASMSRLREVLNVYVPEDVRYVFNRFNELLDSETQLLNGTSIDIDLAYKSYILGFIEDSKKYLDDSSLKLFKANLTHNELREASIQLSRLVGIPLRQLSDKIDLIRDVIDRYWFRIRDLWSMVTYTGEVYDTYLTISIDRFTVWIGSKVRVNGCLLSINPLGGRVIDVYVENIHVASLNTDSRGYFNGEVSIPYIYRSEASLYASFTPRGDDIGRFKASTSNIVKISLLYITPTIKAFIDRGYVKPSDIIHLVGSINPRIPRVYVEFFNQNYTLNVDDNGLFNTTLTIPICEGTYSIRVYSYGLNIIAPSETIIKINVYRLALNLTFNPPTIALSGFRNVFTGLVLSNNIPVRGSVILEVYDQVYVTDTDIHGFFSIDVQTSPTIHTGKYGFKVRFTPFEPWYRESMVEGEVFTVNLYMIPAPIILLLILIGASIPKRRVERIKPSTPVEIKEAPSIILEGIVKIYFEALGIVEGKTGIFMKPYDTIREYLVKVENSLKNGAFRELSFMVEAYLYGGVEPNMDRALDLFESIKGYYD